MPCKLQGFWKCTKKQKQPLFPSKTLVYVRGYTDFVVCCVGWSWSLKLSGLVWPRKTYKALYFQILREEEYIEETHPERLHDPRRCSNYEVHQPMCLPTPQYMAIKLVLKVKKKYWQFYPQNIRTHPKPQQSGTTIKTDQKQR